MRRYKGPLSWRRKFHLSITSALHKGIDTTYSLVAVDPRTILKYCLSTRGRSIVKMCVQWFYRHHCGHILEGPVIYCDAVRNSYRRESNPQAACPTTTESKTQYDPSVCGQGGCLLSRFGGIWDCHRCGEVENEDWKCGNCGHNLCKNCSR